MNEVVRFEDADSCAPAMVGGKAANLGLLSQAGFPVPSGFTVAMKAYPEFILRNGLDRLVRELVDKLDPADADALETGAAEIRALILAGTVPDGIAASIRSAYGALGNDPLVGRTVIRLGRGP